MTSPHKQILYDIEWQSLRTQLLARHSEDGGWATIKGVRRNVGLLEEYLQAKGTAEQKISRYWRVLNLLDAVRMGYSGQQLVGSPQDRAVLRFAGSVRKIYHDMRVQGYAFDLPSEEETIESIRRTPIEDLRRIYVNLLDRWTKHSTSAHRNELRRFLDLIEKYRVEATK